MIRTENLTKVYRTQRKIGLWRSRWEEKTAVQGLTLEIPEGRVTGLLGINGAGKSTTIKMLATLLAPTAGTGTVGGLDLVRDAAKIRPIVNVITGGERGVYWRLTARENLWYFGQLYDIEPRALQRRIAELLELVGLLDAADTPVERYSKGMKQRLQIARGLLNRPRYLFMDEPTLGLDAAIARQLRKMTRELADVQGCGVLLTSHYMFEVEELCDYLYVIERGQLIAEGTPAQIKQRVITDRVARLVVDVQAVEPLLNVLREHLPRGTVLTGESAEQGVAVTARSSIDLTAQLVQLASARGYRIFRAESLEPSLEDAVVALAERAEVPA